MRTQKQLQLQLTTGTVYSEIFTNVYKWKRVQMQTRTNTYKCVQMCTNAHKCVEMCRNTYTEEVATLVDY